MRIAESHSQPKTGTILNETSDKRIACHNSYTLKFSGLYSCSLYKVLACPVSLFIPPVSVVPITPGRRKYYRHFNVKRVIISISLDYCEKLRRCFKIDVIVINSRRNGKCLNVIHGQTPAPTYHVQREAIYLEELIMRNRGMDLCYAIIGALLDGCLPFLFLLSGEAESNRRNRARKHGRQEN